MYRLFLKHWKSNMMPPVYRGEIIFINDSQEFTDLDMLATEFGYWADFFAPNIVMYQIGYSSDYDWWKDEPNPPKKIGEQIALNVTSSEQEIGIVWVDFTLHPTKYPELNELFDGSK